MQRIIECSGTVCTAYGMAVTELYNKDRDIVISRHVRSQHVKRRVRLIFPQQLIFRKQLKHEVSYCIAIQTYVIGKTV